MIRLPLVSLRGRWRCICSSFPSPSPSPLPLPSFPPSSVLRSFISTPTLLDVKVKSNVTEKSPSLSSSSTLSSHTSDSSSPSPYQKYKKKSEFPPKAPQEREKPRQKIVNNKYPNNNNNETDKIKYLNKKGKNTFASPSPSPTPSPSSNRRVPSPSSATYSSPPHIRPSFPPIPPSANFSSPDRPSDPSSSLSDSDPDSSSSPSFLPHSFFFTLSSSSSSPNPSLPSHNLLNEYGKRMLSRLDYVSVSFKDFYDEFYMQLQRMMKEKLRYEEEERKNKKNNNNGNDNDNDNDDNDDEDENHISSSIQRLNADILCLIHTFFDGLSHYHTHFPHFTIGDPPLSLYEIAKKFVNFMIYSHYPTASHSPSSSTTPPDDPRWLYHRQFSLPLTTLPLPSLMTLCLMIDFAGYQYFPMKYKEWQAEKRHHNSNIHHHESNNQQKNLKNPKSKTKEESPSDNSNHKGQNFNERPPSVKSSENDIKCLLQEILFYSQIEKKLRLIDSQLDKYFRLQRENKFHQKKTQNSSPPSLHSHHTSKSLTLSALHPLANPIFNVRNYYCSMLESLLRHSLFHHALALTHYLTHHDASISHLLLSYKYYGVFLSFILSDNKLYFYLDDSVATHLSVEEKGKWSVMVETKMLRSKVYTMVSMIKEREWDWIRKVFSVGLKGGLERWSRKMEKGEEKIWEGEKREEEERRRERREKRKEEEEERKIWEK